MNKYLILLLWVAIVLSGCSGSYPFYDDSESGDKADAYDASMDKNMADEYAEAMSEKYEDERNAQLGEEAFYRDRATSAARENAIYDQNQSETEERINASIDNCLIKGNIAFNSGEKIYHMPGQKYYEKTKIDTQYGERWFCSEEEARDAGWRKAAE